MRKAARFIRERIAHYMKVDIDNVPNSAGISTIKQHSQRMKPVKLNIDIDKGIATATLFKEQAAHKKHQGLGAEQQASTKMESKDVKKGSAQTAKEGPPYLNV